MSASLICLSCQVVIDQVVILSKAKDLLFSEVGREQGSAGKREGPGLSLAEKTGEMSGFSR